MAGSRSIPRAAQSLPSSASGSRTRSSKRTRIWRSAGTPARKPRCSRGSPARSAPPARAAFERMRMAEEDLRRAWPRRTSGPWRRDGGGDGCRTAPRTPPRPAAGWPDRGRRRASCRPAMRPPQPLLELAVEALRRQLLAPRLVDDPPRLLDAAPAHLHDGADQPLPARSCRGPEKAASRSAMVSNESSSSSGGAKSRGWPPSMTRSRVEPERGGERTKTAGGFFGRGRPGTAAGAGPDARKAASRAVVDRGRRRPPAESPPRRRARRPRGGPRPPGSSRAR